MCLQVVKLVVELCAIAKTLQPADRASFFKVMTEQGIFGCLEQMLGDSESRLRASAVEILDMAVRHEPSLVRRHLLSLSQKVSGFLQSSFFGFAHLPINFHFSISHFGMCTGAELSIFPFDCPRARVRFGGGHSGANG
eukprot:SAG31_NODE_2503_length_5594_cov_1.758326_4_plen_138_part_00